MAVLGICVIGEDEEPLKGVRVKLEFTGLARGMSDEKRTDSEGMAFFHGYEEGPVRIYLNGTSYGGYYYEDGDKINIWK
jgi:hypothetical protein